MFDPFTLALIGAGTGALIDRKKPLRGAAIGGTLGYGGGTLLGTSAVSPAGAEVAKNAIASNIAAGVPGFTAGAAGAGAAGAGAAGTIESAGLKTIGSGSTLYNPEYFANAFGNPIYTGNGGLLSQIGTGTGTIFDMAKDELGNSFTPQNLLGVSMLLNNMNQAQPMPSGGGGTQGGTPPKFEPFVTGQVYGRKKRGNA